MPQRHFLQKFSYQNEKKEEKSDASKTLPLSLFAYLLCLLWSSSHCIATPRSSGDLENAASRFINLMYTKQRKRQKKTLFPGASGYAPHRKGFPYRQIKPSHPSTFKKIDKYKKNYVFDVDILTISGFGLVFAQLFEYQYFSVTLSCDDNS